MLVVVTAGMAQPPALVSPVAFSADRCPTFSWAGAAAAAGYELVVYEVGEDGPRNPLLYARLPAGATTWTAPATACLTAEGRYAWTVRVLGSGEGGDWSDPALFEVARGPSVAAVEEAIETLRQYLAAGEGRRESKVRFSGGPV